METQPTLICIPDISGFTRFMSDADIELSSSVVPSLLNKIIYSNQIGLKVSEIEGDAVLFYKTGPLPSFKTLIEQCRVFYTEFYKQLAALKEEHKGQRLASVIPDILGLKIIVHYGKEIGAIPIGQSIKLMGEDVIIAHRLLKNDIPGTEYLLISSGVLDEYDEQDIQHSFEWGTLLKGDEKYKHLGDISYSYINLEPLVP